MGKYGLYNLVFYIHLFFFFFFFFFFFLIGWYKVDYGYSEEMNWGRNAGCDFVDDKCIDGNNVNSGAAFCDDINQSVISCTSSRMSKGTCYTAQYSSNLPEAYQYFDDPTLGGESLSDYCPSYELYLTNSGTSSCIDSSNQPSDNENFLGKKKKRN